MGNSTQLTQIALDNIIRDIAAHANISLSSMQQAMQQPKSPIHALYQAMLSELSAMQACEQKLNAFQSQKKAINERLRKVQKLLFANNDPSLESTFRYELTQSSRLEKELDELIIKMQRVLTKCAGLRQARLKQVKNLLNQYDHYKEELKNLCLENHYSDFSEKDINDEVAELLLLTTRGNA